MTTKIQQKKISMTNKRETINDTNSATQINSNTATGGTGNSISMPKNTRQRIFSNDKSGQSNIKNEKNDVTHLFPGILTENGIWMTGQQLFKLTGEPHCERF